MSVIVDLLQQLGLNKYEAEAYYTLLAHGALTGYEVGKYSHVPGSRSYEILERLLEKGLALVQPGDPPRYIAQNPQYVFERIRSTMETTLNTLATSLVSLTQTERMSEFWVVRGPQNILAQTKNMIAGAQSSLDLVLPAHCDVSENLLQAKARDCRVFRATPEGQDRSILLLLCDNREAFVGTMTTLDSCQAVVTSNVALLAALRGYFLHRQSTEEVASDMIVRDTQPFAIDWVDWEARKQRHLLHESSENRVA